MSYRLLIILILGSVLQCIYSIFITDRISKREAKKASYDCSKCKNWKCYYYYCKKQKQKLENKLVKNNLCGPSYTNNLHKEKH